MKFIKLHIENFLSIGNLSLNLDRRGVTLITGVNLDNQSCAVSNGSGKSAIWDALVWCLYGRPIRDIGPDDVAHNKEKGECRVWLRLTDDTGKEWKIERTRKDRQNSLTLVREGEDVSGRTATISQTKIDNLLSFDFKSFVASVIFGQDTIKFTRLTDAEKKSVLETLLGLEIYNAACMEARQSITSNKVMIEMAKSSYANAKSRYFDLVHRIKEYRGKYKSERKEVKKRIRNLRLSIKRKIKRVKLGKRAYEIRLEKIDGLKDRLSRAQTIKAKIQELNNRISELHYEAKDAMKNRVLVNLPDSKCVLCGQELSNLKSKKTTRLNYKYKLNELKISISRVKDKRDELEKDGVNIKSLERRLARMFVEGDELKKYVDGEMGIVISLKAQMKNLKESPIFSASALKELKIQARQAKKEFYAHKHDAVKIERKISILRYWEKAFGPSGIRSYLLDDVVPFLNRRANRYSSIMTDGDMHIEFSTLTRLKSGDVVDKFNVEVTNKHGAKTYHGNSAGERQRIDLCIALALKDLAHSRGTGKIDLMVCDEVFEKLDEAGSAKVITLLNEEVDNFGTCFVITHNENLKPFFSNRITLTKKNGITSLEG